MQIHNDINMYTSQKAPEIEVGNTACQSSATNHGTWWCTCSSKQQSDIWSTYVHVHEWSFWM